MRTVTTDSDDAHSRYYFARIKAGASVGDDPEQVATAVTHAMLGLTEQRWLLLLLINLAIIRDALSERDPANAEYFSANHDKFAAKVGA